jgi:hypothetical protein
MDTDISEISTTCVNNNTQFSELVLGLCTSIIPYEVPNLNKFTYDKSIGSILQEQLRKVSIMRGNPISLLTMTLVMENVNKDLISISSNSTAFMTMT